MLSWRIQPWAILAPYIDEIRIEEQEKIGPAPSLYEIIPRNAIVMGFQYGDRLKVFRNGHQQTLAYSGLTGLQTSVRYGQDTGEARYIIVIFKPGCAPAFLPGSMADFVNRHVDLRHVLRQQEVCETQRRVWEALSRREKVDAVQEFLVQCLRKDPVDPLVRAAIQRLQGAGGDLCIRNLAREFSISQRQFERRFRNRVGTSPKQFAVLLRFRQSLRLRREGLKTVEIAQVCGYFDQAHFTRDFKGMTGLPPKAHFSRPRRPSGPF